MKKTGRINKPKIWFFFDDQDNKKDVKIKSNTEMDGIEAIPYASLKRENDIDDKEWKLETAAEIEKQTAEREKKIIKSELKQDKVDMQVSRESDIKEVQDVFGEVKEEEPLNVENFFIGDNDIFDSEGIANADREFIIDLINRSNFIANSKKFIEESNASKMEILHPEEKKLRRKNRCRLTMMKREKMQALKIV